MPVDGSHALPLEKPAFEAIEPRRVIVRAGEERSGLMDESACV